MRAIIQIDHPHHVDEAPIRMIEGRVNLRSFLRLLDTADLSANPRESKTTASTIRDMWRSLDDTPELFHHKNKGLLLACSAVESLASDRFRLEFEPVADPARPRGILDGGHTTLAIGVRQLQRTAERLRRRIPKIRVWRDFADAWPNWREDVFETLREDDDFRVKVEIIYPHKETAADFDEWVLDVAQARNNNTQLTAETRSNKRGFYEEVKSAIPDGVAKEIEWKTNDGGQIKSRDVIALSLIPLSAIGQKELGVHVEPSLVYNQKSRCVSVFDDIYRKHSQANGAQHHLTSNLIASGIKLTREIIQLYDWLYEHFPTAYTRNGGKFGKITSVKNWPSSTKFFGRRADFTYPDAFILPLLVASRRLIKRDGDRLYWAYPPIDFYSRYLDQLAQNFAVVIRMANYDPQKVGKSADSYVVAMQAVTTAKLMMEREDPGKHGD